MAIKNLQEKFVHALGDIYDAEHRFLEAQQKMQAQADSQTVLELFEKHIPETEEQIANLEEIYELLGEKPKRVKCAGAAGIVSEGEKLLGETSEVPALADLAIAGANAKVEHYEITCYQSLILGAEMMGEKEIVKLLKKNLKQEQQTAKKIEKNMPALYEQAMNGETAASMSA